MYAFHPKRALRSGGSPGHRLPIADKRLPSGSTARATPSVMADPAPSAQATDAFADRRLYPRVEVALPAFLQANGERHAVHLLDLSAGGAKLSCPVCLSSGTAVTLECGTLARAAVTRWQNGGQLGICFDRELDAREVGALIDRSTALACRMKTRE